MPLPVILTTIKILVMNLLINVSRSTQDPWLVDKLYINIIPSLGHNPAVAFGTKSCAPIIL